MQRISSWPKAPRPSLERGIWCITLRDASGWTVPQRSTSCQLSAPTHRWCNAYRPASAGRDGKRSDAVAAPLQAEVGLQLLQVPRPLHDGADSSIAAIAIVVLVLV